MTPREIRAIQNARIGMLREDWFPFATAAAAYFEGNRDKKVPGQPITREHFLLSTGSDAERSIELQTEAKTIDREIELRLKAGDIPSWAKAHREKKKATGRRHA